MAGTVSFEVLHGQPVTALVNPAVTAASDAPAYGSVASSDSVRSRMRSVETVPLSLPATFTAYSVSMTTPACDAKRVKEVFAPAMTSTSRLPLWPP